MQWYVVYRTMTLATTSNDCEVHFSSAYSIPFNIQCQINTYLTHLLIIECPWMNTGLWLSMTWRAREVIKALCAIKYYILLLYTSVSFLNPSSWGSQRRKRQCSQWQAEQLWFTSYVLLWFHYHLESSSLIHKDCLLWQCPTSVVHQPYNQFYISSQTASVASAGSVSTNNMCASSDIRQYSKSSISIVPVYITNILLSSLLLLHHHKL